MHSTLDLVIYLGVAAAFCFAYGYIISAIITGAREKLDDLQLAERADVNGRQLLVIARHLRHVGNEFGVDVILPRNQVNDWAGDLEAIAVAHMECINAIGLDALHAVRGDRPEYLGEFRSPRRHRDGFAQERRHGH